MTKQTFDDAPAALNKLPPSSSLVWIALVEADAPRTMKEIRQSTPLSYGGVQSGIDHLRKADLIIRQPAGSGTNALYEFVISER